VSIFGDARRWRSRRCAQNADRGGSLPFGVGDALSETGNAGEIAAKVCLIGQPVALGHRAVLRISAGARLVSESWSSREVVARENLQRELGHLRAIVAKIEWLLG
jgi:hypothetical protein